MIAGEPDFHYLVSPYSVVTDSRGRIIVTDVGRRRRPHFRFRGRRNISSSRGAMREKIPCSTPQCVAVDSAGQYLRHRFPDRQNFCLRCQRQVPARDRQPERRRGILQASHGHRGRFRRPAHLCDRHAAQQDFHDGYAGQHPAEFGKTGAGDGEFNFPTELRLNGEELVVVDAMNFRVQVLDRSGAFNTRSAKSATARDGSSGPKESASTPRDIFTSSTASGALFKCSTRKGAALLLWRTRHGHGPVSVTRRIADRQPGPHLCRRLL